MKVAIPDISSRTPVLLFYTMSIHTHSEFIGRIYVFHSFLSLPSLFIPQDSHIHTYIQNMIVAAGYVFCCILKLLLAGKKNDKCFQCWLWQVMKWYIWSNRCFLIMYCADKYVVFLFFRKWTSLFLETINSWYINKWLRFYSEFISTLNTWYCISEIEYYGYVK